MKYENHFKGENLNGKAVFLFYKSFTNQDVGKEYTIFEQDMDCDIEHLNLNLNSPVNECPRPDSSSSSQKPLESEMLFLEAFHIFTGSGVNPNDFSLIDKGWNL